MIQYYTCRNIVLLNSNYPKRKQMNNLWFFINKVQKNFFRLILLFLFFTDYKLASYTQHDTGLLKNRVVQRLKQKQLNVLLKEIGAENMQDAQYKVRDIQQLFEVLNAENINHALTNVKHVRDEFGSTIEHMRAEFTSTLQHKDVEIDKILTILNVKTVDEAVCKINQLQSSYQQIIQFAQNLNDNQIVK